MAKKKKKTRVRTVRRTQQRRVKKEIELRERLASLEPGGSSERPIEANSASTVELNAQGLGCIHCPGIPRVEEHEAVKVGSEILRSVALRCPRCESRRQVWVRIVTEEARLN